MSGPICAFSDSTIYYTTHMDTINRLICTLIILDSLYTSAFLVSSGFEPSCLGPTLVLWTERGIHMAVLYPIIYLSDPPHLLLLLVSGMPFPQVSPWLWSFPGVLVRGNLGDNRDKTVIAQTYSLLEHLDVNQMLRNIILSGDYTGLLNFNILCSYRKLFNFEWR